MGCVFLICCLCSPLGAQSKPASSDDVSPGAQWQQLIESHDIDGAKSLCGKWLSSANLSEQIEAQKCLANVALAQGSRLSLQGNETGGGTLGEGYSSEAVEEALSHLNQGIRLAPQDRSIHQGRLHVLEVSGRYEEMVKAVDESASLYKGADAPDIWLAYAQELAEGGEPTTGLHFCEVLDKHYPNNSSIIGNIGAFLNMLDQWDQGLPYLRRAVALSPSDAIDTWNLGWSLKFLGRNDEANTWMAKSIQLGGESDVSQRKCLYGQFLATKMNKVSEGCALVRSNCGEEDRSACEEGQHVLPAKPTSEKH